MELIERIQQLERELKTLRPELHFPSTATLEQRLRWLEIVLEEMRARDSHGVYAETPSEEKLRQLLAHTVYIKPDRITLHSLTADPATVIAGDMWFRSDMGKSKWAIDSVVANSKLIRREGDTIPAAEIASLDAAKITTGRFGEARLPDGTSGQVLTGQGAGVDPAYAAAAGVPSGVIAMWHGTIANIPSGWVICDGNNGSPNLLARFVEGVATAATNPGATGGTFTKSLYPGTEYAYTMRHYVGVATGAETGSLTDGDITTGTGFKIVSNLILDARPLFYDIAFIMKT